MFNRTIRVQIKQTTTCDVQLEGTDASIDNVMKAINEGRIEIIGYTMDKILTENGHDFEVEFDENILDRAKAAANKMIQEGEGDGQ